MSKSSNKTLLVLAIGYLGICMALMLALLERYDEASELGACEAVVERLTDVPDDFERDVKEAVRTPQGNWCLTFMDQSVR